MSQYWITCYSFVNLETVLTLPFECVEENFLEKHDLLSDVIKFKQAEKLKSRSSKR